MQDSARDNFVVVLAGYSLLSAIVTFHYSISHVTKFKGRSLLVFPQAVYDKDPTSVRRLWIRIFNLIGLTSMVLLAVICVYLWSYSIARASTDAKPVVTLPFMLGVIVVGLIAQPARNLILRYPCNLVVVAKLNQVIAQNAKPREARRRLSPRRSDPLSWARKELIHIARILERLAKREDSRYGVGTSHPAAAIYRAVADHIRQYCKSPKSLEDSLPSNLISTLMATEGFVITGDSVWRKQLVRRLNVFDSDGSPRLLATVPTTGGAMSTVRTAARYVDLALLWLQNRWQAIVIVLAIGAFLLGALNLDSLLGVAQ